MSEESEIKRVGMTPQKNSGRGKKDKGDATWDKFLVDVKEYSKSYSLSRANWAKISRDSITSGLFRPALNVVLGSGSEPRLRLWVISEAEMLEYMELLNERDRRDSTEE